MKPLEGSWNIVLAGAWNNAIINPKWLGQHVFKNDRVKFDMLMPVEGDQRVMRFTEHGVQIVMEGGRLLLSPLGISAESMDAVESTAVSILELLDHTPIAACGINYAWKFDQRPDELAWISTLGDSDKLAEVKAVAETKVHRRLEGIGDHGEPVLNFQLWDKPDGSFEIKFNFHYDVNSTADGARRIKGAFRGLLDCADKVLAVYGLKADSLNEED